MTHTPNTGSHPAHEEKRRGSLAWLWLALAALILALLVWWFVANDDDEDADVDTSPPAAVEGDEEPAEEPADDDEAVAVIRVGDTDLFDAAEDGVDPATLVGESVEGNSVKVQAVVADEAFFVGPEGGETVLVYLPDFAGEKESPFNVETGDTVSFTGTVKEVDQELLSKMQLSDAPQMETGDLYIEADQLSPTT